MHVPPIVLIITVVVCVAVLVIPFLFAGPRAIGANNGWQLLAQSYTTRLAADGALVEASKALIGATPFGGQGEPKLLLHASESGLHLSQAGGSSSDWSKFESPDILIPWKKFTYYNATSNGVSLILAEPSLRLEIAAPGLDAEVARFMRMNA